MLRITCFIPHTAYCILHTAYCILHTAYCILHTAYCILHTAYCILHTAYCILHTSYYILYTGKACQTQTDADFAISTATNKKKFKTSSGRRTTNGLAPGTSEKFGWNEWPASRRRRRWRRSVLLGPAAVAHVHSAAGRRPHRLAPVYFLSAPTSAAAPATTSTKFLAKRCSVWFSASAPFPTRRLPAAPAEARKLFQLLADARRGWNARPARPTLVNRADLFWTKMSEMLDYFETPRITWCCTE